MKTTTDPSFVIRISAAIASGTTLVAAFTLFTAAPPARAQTFSDIHAGLPGVASGSAAWGDYDNDGRLDILLTGVTNGLTLVPIAQVWRNTGSGFTNINAGLPGVWRSSIAWGDYDSDGRLDILLTGHTGTNVIAQVWRNSGSGFTNINAGLPGVWSGSVAWGDYDNDGRLDILLTGATGTSSGFLSQVWRNTGSGFTNINAGLPGVASSSVAWGDYDNDGRLDILLTGIRDLEHSELPIAQVWRNTGNGFTNINAGLPGVYSSSAAWGDYDNDGRLDILLTGNRDSDGFAFISQVWRNTGSGFTNINAGLPELAYSSVAWGDYDNDGRLDILLTGVTRELQNSSPLAEVWRNMGSGFTNINAGLPGVASSSVAWGDYDNDGRLDILLTGAAGPNEISQAWRNDTPLTNTPPGAPTGLAMTATANAVMLSWNSPMDGQTPAGGLTYNVRAGTTPGGNDLLSAPGNGANGFRCVPAMGNAMLRHNLPLTGLTNGQTVYWSVQAVDSAFAGGPFAEEMSVVSLPQLMLSLNPQPSTLNLSWTPPTFGWVLQQSTNLGASDWIPAASGGANPATFPATNGAQFYRLSKP